MSYDDNRFEALSDPDTLPSVRAYTWARPAVTWGPSQSALMANHYYPGLDSAKRRTGGKLVLHGEDLTLSIVARYSDVGEEIRIGPRRIYRRIVDSVRDALTSSGTRVCSGKETRSRASEVHCFDSALECDLVDAETGLKLVGCAQARTREAFIVQMSIQQRQNDWNLLHEIRNNLKSELSIAEWVSR